MTRSVDQLQTSRAPRWAAFAWPGIARVPGLAIVVALALWLLSLPFMDPDRLNDYGLVAIVPPQYWAALAVLSFGFALGLSTYRNGTGIHFAALIVLVLILHATPPLVYGTLRYSWAWKHIGIVDYIQRHDEVNRTISFLAAYHNWPGFFWISARLAEYGQLQPIEIAKLVRFFPVVANVVFLLLLRSIFRRFTDDNRLIYAALWVFVCANWVGQDYFSPQAFTYALHLLVLALCLGPLMPAPEPAKSRVGQWLGQMRSKITEPGPPQPNYAAWQKVLAVIVMYAAVLTIVMSHQLTPLILILSLGGLAVVTTCGVGLPVLAAFALVFWVIYPAAPFTAAHLPGEVAQLGQTIEGVTGKLVDTGAVDRGVAVVVWASRSLSAAVVLLALVGGLRRLRAGHRDGVAVVLLVAPMLILGVTTYGGEAVFRIYFFCLPFLAFFCAAAFFPSRQRGAGMPVRIGFGLAIVLMSIGFLFGNNGKDQQYRFSTDEVAAARWVYEHGGPQTLLVEGARSYPSQFMNYENFTYLPISHESPSEQEKILAAPASVFDRWFSDPRWKDGYVILTRSQTAYVEALGIMPDKALDEMSLALLSSPDFRLVFANRDARVFRSSRFAARQEDREISEDSTGLKPYLLKSPNRRSSDGKKWIDAARRSPAKPGSEIALSPASIRLPVARDARLTLVPDPVGTLSRSRPPALAGPIETDELPRADRRPGAETPFDPTRGQIRAAQGALNQLGYAVGPADGIVGRRTLAGIVSFQRDNGFPQTGRLTLQMINRLETQTLLGQ